MSEESLDSGPAHHQREAASVDLARPKKDVGSTTVLLADEQSVSVDHERLKSLARSVIENLQRQGELSILLVDEDSMASLRRQWLDEEGPTDVLSFAMNEHGLLGDVVICPSVAVHSATSRQRSLQTEVDLLLVHGILHLFGYDHEDPADEERMRRLEMDLLQRYI